LDQSAIIFLLYEFYKLLTIHRIEGDMEQINIGYRLEGLKVEHRDLDYVITRLTSQPNIDNDQIQRLKKRKLVIRDTISRLELSSNNILS